METQHITAAPQPFARNRFEKLLHVTGVAPLDRAKIEILQINMGKLCNQACTHCHVEAGPKRTEVMERQTLSALLKLAAHPDIRIVDVTGGAPEMNPHFRELVSAIADMGKEILLRCNLTIIEEPGFEWLPEFYARHRAHLICSLPCYTRGNVDGQRGRGVFDKSISAMRKLNEAGYGIAEHPGGLQLDLVYNPAGTFLPPGQQELENDYKREFESQFGIFFNRLLTLANIPIGRYGRSLRKSGQYEPYMNLLEDSFNGATVPHLMCRNTLSVGWDGKIYDCDFNQMLDLEIIAGHSALDADFSLEKLAAIPIRTGDHCLGCTAGSGSSCGGALA